MGLIATRSLDTPVTGIKDLKREHEARIRSGIGAYAALQRIKSGDRSPEAMAAFQKVKADLGYGLLLKKYTDRVVDATPEQIRAAVSDTIPDVAVVFWSFRIMVGLGLWFLFLFGAAFYVLARRRLAVNRWLMHLALWSIPLPWIAIELGWIVAEYGRQPWAISEVLPTHLGVSSVSAGQVWFSLCGFFVFYTALLVVELYLMFKYARLGPASLGTGRYQSENGEAAS
jgi:cytochrome d ubiquinol oxidase subunit I